MLRQRAGTILAVVLAGIACLSGCASGAGGNKDTEVEKVPVLSPVQMEEEYWQETKILKLPAGTTWPPVVQQSPAPDHQGVMRDHSYEPGYGQALAQDAWFCAWQKEWLTQRGVDTDREQKAMTTLLDFKTMANYTERADDTFRALVDDLLEKASLGDPSVMARNVELNCPKG